MVDEEVKPEYYFDLSKFKHRALFDNAEYVWDALKDLDVYINEQLKKLGKGDRSGVAKPDEKTGAGGAVVGDNVYLGKGTTVDHFAVIQGPAIIGDNCIVQSFAYVRENVLVGNYTRIGYCTELKHCILFGGDGEENDQRLNLSHLNYVGYSILGRKVLLGRGTGFSPLRLNRKNTKVKVGEKEFYTELEKFGAVIGDESKIGSSVTLDPGSLIGKKSLIFHIPYWGGFLASGKTAKGKNLKEHQEIVDNRDAG